MSRCCRLTVSLFMGHVNEDYDAIGATIGMAKLGLSLGKETYIVSSEHNVYYKRITEVLDNENIILSANETKYIDIMRSGADALPLVTNKSLLVIVDHHREVLSASKAVLQACRNRIIIDHHRRAEDIIGDTTLLYLEPSSSSTSELVTELIGYFDDRLDITPAEANSLLCRYCTGYEKLQCADRRAVPLRLPLCCAAAVLTRI